MGETNYASGEDYVVEFLGYRFGFNATDFEERITGAAVRLGLIEANDLDDDETADLVELAADGRIAEIEQVIERNEMTAQRVEALGAPRAAFSTPIPVNERMSRADLITRANKYFSGMQRNDGKGDYPFHERCDLFGERQ